MIDALVMLAAEAAHGEETSKTFFYVTGGALAVWAVIMSALGLARGNDWPSESVARGLMAFTAGLVALTMVSSIVTG